MVNVGGLEDLAFVVVAIISMPRTILDRLWTIVEHDRIIGRELASSSIGSQIEIASGVLMVAGARHLCHLLNGHLLSGHLLGSHLLIVRTTGRPLTAVVTARLACTVSHLIHLIHRTVLTVVLKIGGRLSEGRVAADVRRTRFVCITEFRPPLVRILGELSFVLFQDVEVIVNTLCDEERLR